MMQGFLKRCWKCEQGLAAMEFAFVLPIILTMLLGMVELSQALGVRAEIINMASTGADLIAQEATAKGSDLDGAFNALNAMLYPHDVSVATITITSVIDGGAGKSPIVAWSCSMGSGATPATKGTTPSNPTIPAGLITQGGGGSVIWSHVTYAYTSNLSYFLVGTKNWKNDFYLKPRRVLQIPYSSNPASTLGTCNF
ncbi:MAG: TadE/TadG family type IV pilus assembly protein [Pseudomonadota bacterium]